MLLVVNVNGRVRSSSNQCTQAAPVFVLSPTRFGKFNKLRYTTESNCVTSCSPTFHSLQRLLLQADSFAINLRTTSRSISVFSIKIHNETVTSAASAHTLARHSTQKLWHIQTAIRFPVMLLGAKELGTQLHESAFAGVIRSVAQQKKFRRYTYDIVRVLFASSSSNFACCLSDRN